MSYSFPKTSRLLNKAEYAAVFNGHPIKAHVRSGTVLAIKSTTEESRLGVIVAKRNVRLAAQRNRVKRAVREHFRCHPLSTPIDLVFMARQGAGNQSNAELRRDLEKLWQKLASHD